MSGKEELLNEFYANVIDSVGDGVIALDSDGCVSLMNPAAEEITGVSRRQAQGNTFASIFNKEPLLLEMVEKTASTGMTVSDHENLVIRKGSSVTPVSATTSPLLLKNGEQVGIVLILRDLTNIRELEQTIRHADRLSTLGTLAAGLAHEIKNPLGGIKGAAQLLEREMPEDSDLCDYTRIMVKEVERVNRLLEELLDLAAPKKLANDRVNLHKALNDIILMQIQSIKDQQVTFQQQFDPSIPPILGDERLLTQVFLNLVKNAIEAVGESGLIRVATRILSDYSLTHKGERPSRMVAIDIHDDGPGIQKEQLELLFTPFFTTKSAGTGLGLAICQKIVTEHRGMIKVESDPGKGTTFTVMLPLIQ